MGQVIQMPMAEQKLTLSAATEHAQSPLIGQQMMGVG